MLSSVYRLVCYPGLPSETMRACDRLHLWHQSSYQVRGSIYHAYNFQLTVPSSRIERLLDPTTYIYASHMKPKQPCPSTSQQTMYCYVTLLAAQPLLVCMLGYIQLLSYLSLGWLSHCYILFLDDMVIINVDYIRRRMEGRAIPSDVLFHSSHLGPEFRVLFS